MPASPKMRKMVVVLLVAGITFLHYQTASHKTFYHIFFRELYFLPIILAAFWFGLRGGVLTALAVTILYTPSAFWISRAEEERSFANLLEIILYNIVGGLLGWLRNREERQQNKLRTTAGLTAMGQAISAIAHDMKTPLVAISGYTRQILRKMRPEDPARQKLDLVLRQADRLDVLVRDMLAFARPLELTAEKADLRQLVTETIELSMPAAKKHSIFIEERLPEEEMPAIFDRNRLQQALVNLLINAIEASPPGGRVTVLGFRHTELACIEVIDQGEGIPPERREKIFAPFFTTKQEGTGLGLPIVKRIVEAHSGVVQVSENQGGGTIFRITLPLS